MKKYKYLSTAIMSLALFFALGVVGFANSSWHWLTNIRPYYLLPIAVIITLVIECSLIKLSVECKMTRVVFFVTLANLVSYLLPYEILYLMGGDGNVYTPAQMFERTPSYMIGLGYLLLTLTTEFPIVFVALTKHCSTNSKLIKNIVLSNVLTTVMIFAMEHIFAPGSW